MPVRKAVIPAAGLGTRFLPATKAQQKAMLPVVDKPSIQYVVEEAVARGADRHPDRHRARQPFPRGPLRSFVRARALPRVQGQVRRAEAGASDQRHGVDPLHPPEGSVGPGARGLGRRGSHERRAVRGPARRRPDPPLHAAAARDAPRPRAVRQERHRRPRGAARGDPVLRMRRAGMGRGEPRPRPVDRREAVAGGRAVQPGGDRPVRAHARHLRRAPRHRTGRGWRDPADRRDQPAGQRAGRSTPTSSIADGTTSATSSTTSRPRSSSPWSATTSETTSAGTCWTCSATTGSAETRLAFPRPLAETTR